MSTILIFVRHGESEGNRADSFNGHSDVKLTEKGHLQAEKTAEFLDDYKIDAIYSSDLSRAYDTALHTATRKKLPVITRETLREINGGDFEEVKYKDIMHLYPEAYQAWVSDMGNSRCPNGESVREVANRICREVERIAENHKGQTVMITTHGTPMRILSTIWAGKDIANIREVDWVKNASVSIVDYDDVKHPKVLLFNAHEHLSDVLTELPTYI